jgi:predicted alpha-1,2-mannosidase
MARLSLLLVLAFSLSTRQHERLTPYVDPFIGTGGHGHTYPGPSMPFGMIQPGPDTRLDGWDGVSGYHYSDARIFGFSHTHLSGTGIHDYTDILVMPSTGDVRLNNGADGRPGYASAFSKDTEVARPGYYAVTLQDSGIRAELTTTTRVGMHRYQLPAAAPAFVVLDLDHRDALLESAITPLGDREVVGLRRSRSWARDQVVYFVIRFSRPFSSAEGGGFPPDRRRAFTFGSSGGPLLVKVAISAVSIDGARRNMDAELPGWDFEAVRGQADAAWERELSKIRVDGGTREQRVVFYTALYHSMLAPNVYMDVDGQYRGRDQQIHRANGFTYYSVFSLWDTFRTLHPLLGSVDRERTRDFVRTFLRQYQEGGRLPVWELAGNETDTMIGYHAAPVIADAVARGIDGFDLPLAYQAMKHSADEDRFGLRAYRRDGYIDASEEAEGVSRTLEYAYDDWTVAQVARRLGRGDDYRHYLRRSESYKHLFDPATGFMRARVEGLWVTPFDPAEVNNHYTEANAWQYSFFVPHDVEGLIRLYGGDEAFVRKLDAMFAADSRTTGRDQADITGLIGQYAHGNEPSHHMAYLYAYAGQPFKTQAMVRRIMDTMYAARPDGLSGNEDCGQMSAWFVLSALGFYPVAPGSTHYVLGSPLFERATIRLENGREFVIAATGAGAGPYVQQVRLNGADHPAASLEHGAIAAGGELSFRLGSQPNRDWGSRPASRPRSTIGEPSVVPLPFVASGTRLFRGTQQVVLGTAERGADIRFSVDGSEPTRESPRYTQPVPVDRSLTLKARAFAHDRESPVMSVAFRQLSDFPRIRLSAPYAPQYAAAGDDTLIDGLRGNESFKTGRWQGYRVPSLRVTLDLGKVQDVREVSMGFLQDIGSWIFMPRSLAVFTSIDGDRFQMFAATPDEEPDRDSKARVHDWTLSVRTPVQARHVLVIVRGLGTIPDWHQGAGETAWFFTDEIIVR